MEGRPPERLAAALQGRPIEDDLARLAHHLLDDLVLYRADPERLKRLQQAGITVAEIVITAGGVEMRFAEPK